MSTQLVDIGVNLTDPCFHEDLQLVITEAADQQVSPLMITGTDLAESETAIKLCGQFPEHTKCTVGVHPHQAKTWTDKHYERLFQLSQQPNVVAIGETGLDFNRNFSPQDQQLKVFDQQLQLAVETQLPLFLHERDAHFEQLGLISRYRDRLAGGVSHCFTGNREALARYLDLDLYIGITGWICDERRGTELQSLVKQIPLERLLLETDAPYLLPRNLRPKPKKRRNEPKYLPHIAQYVADLLDIPVSVLAQATTQNAQRLFPGIMTKTQPNPVS